jgi:hypothetical protein
MTTSLMVNGLTLEKPPEVELDGVLSELNLSVFEL